MPTDFSISRYLALAAEVCRKLDSAAIETIVDELAALRARDGRLFCLGVGGSAANCGHAVNDFRKLCGLEAYAPTDNVAELTARTNDDGWSSVFAAWLEVSRLNARDAVLVLSVGGGDTARNVSANIVKALKLAQARGARILGIVGRDGGYTAKVAHAVAIVPTVDPGLITPLTEAFQALIWHGLVSHPKLKAAPTTWEALAPQ